MVPTRQQKQRTETGIQVITPDQAGLQRLWEAWSDVVEVTPDRQLDVAARDDLAAQDRVAVAANTGCMVSRCHAGDVDFGPLQVVSGGYS